MKNIMLAAVLMALTGCGGYSDYRVMNIGGRVCEEHGGLKFIYTSIIHSDITITCVDGFSGSTDSRGQKVIGDFK